MSGIRDEFDAAVEAGLDDDSETIRSRVTAAFEDERFVAARLRRTDGIPSDPETSERRYDSVAALPETDFDQSAIRTELIVFSETRVYQWTAAGGSVSWTVLPRSPDACGDD
ncbi:hypothetical protein [Halorientalis halophila]|uniref:hypothetical protein n=1 Tax=Halorientalis halophila TaxID=3108499 RepID=UPI003008DD20